jgi:hypothetical protein
MLASAHALRSLVALLLTAACCTVPLAAQDSSDSCAQKPPPGSDPGKRADAGAKQTPPAIQDNSFLIEEAYNQNFGVVQHIQAAQVNWNTHDWTYTFTQEWPVDVSPRNQLSYTIPFVHTGDFAGSGMAIGDVALNYRFQLAGNGDARVAFAPRLSLLLPTGDYHLGRGAGGVGIQTALPLSVVVNRALVTHWNLGSTITPEARNELGQKAATYSYYVGQSTIWTLRPRFNLMLETLFNINQSVAATDRAQTSHNLLVSPGFRWAYNFRNGMQIVPGVAVPVGAGPSAGNVGLFLYFSIEHPFRKLPPK